MSNLQPGKYTARPVDYAFGVTDKGVDYVAVTFDIGFEGGAVESISAYLYFASTENSRISIESLRNCGWTGDDLSADLTADGFGSVEVVLNIINEEYDKDGDKKVALKVKSIYRAGGPAVKNPMDDNHRKAFAAKMRGLAMASKPGGAAASANTPKPAQRAPSNGRSYGPHANEPDPRDPRFNDDIPF